MSEKYYFITLRCVHTDGSKPSYRSYVVNHSPMEELLENRMADYEASKRGENVYVDGYSIVCALEITKEEYEKYENYSGL